ncbi:MAG: hypothetical protein J7604_09470 [Sporocytophaga sp.]|uniref:DUF6495 family protein n=1 Tax=Sporocytophaga sp. TaxID=2231183 RepID=UPI001B268356|nr:DUF6495 family protein [Sporocytophaga sp.]MBO9700424.1 hypothetical protein [Sporocytophaga sp.]
MSEYRLLSLEELQEMENEFVNYLVVNGIAAEDWERMKCAEPAKAERLIELFSDMVFETIMRNVQFLEYREKKELITFQCLSDKLVLVGMKAEGDSEADFTSQDYIKRAMVSPPDGLKVYTSEKKYQKKREIELFEMTQRGCFITEGNLFKTLCLALD